MTRYLEREELSILLSDSEHEAARELAMELAASDTLQLVPVEQVNPQDLLHTYSVRLRRSEAGEGPETWALREFVDCLRRGEPREMFGITIARTSWVGLLDRSGRVVGLTMVRPRAGENPAASLGDEI